jgi:hypothetical protein
MSRLGLLSQPSLKEIRCRLERLHPMLVEEKTVNLVWEHQLFNLDVPLAQLLNQRDRLSECDVSVIIAVDDEHR